jgi:hypothetical protein
MQKVKPVKGMAMRMAKGMSPAKKMAVDNPGRAISMMGQKKHAEMLKSERQTQHFEARAKMK